MPLLLRATYKIIILIYYKKITGTLKGYLLFLQYKVIFILPLHVPRKNFYIQYLNFLRNHVHASIELKILMLKYELSFNIF